MLTPNTLFRFNHRWTVKGNLADAYALVSDPRTFPQWCPLFKQIELSSPSGGLTVGAHCKCQVRAALPYAVKWDITLTDLQPDQITTFCKLKLGSLSMAGTVRYTFRQEGEHVVIENEQALVASRPFPARIHAFFQRLFAWNHAWAMKRGGIGLERLLRGMTGRQRTFCMAA